MRRSKAEDAGGRLPAKDNNEAVVHFNRRTLRFFSCGSYMLHLLEEPRRKPS